MKLFCYGVFVLGLIGVLSIGCSEDPNMVGLGVLPFKDSLTIVSQGFLATSDTVFLSRVVGGSSTLLL